MRIRVNLEDGRKLTYGGRMRYVAFRLTGQGGYSVTSDNSAEACVQFARRKWRDRGFPHLVMDTITGEAIGVYPYVPHSLPKGHPPIHRACESCSSGWDRERGVDDEWQVVHDENCPELV
jgi:hypothetical protein